MRKLRLAFTAAELELLRADKNFANALAASDDSPQSIQALIRQGAALLAERNRHRSTFSPGKGENAE
jgi:hypothetical protein